MRTLPDHVRPGLRVLFVGINPGLRSAALGHHFAGHSNRFWRLLREAALVSEPIGYAEDARLLEWGFGITNLIARPTAGVGELRPEEYARGRLRLRSRLARWRPQVVALVGVSLYRAVFPDKRRAPVRPGLQEERLHGARVFVLPNPSGRNAHFSYAQMLAVFRGLRKHLDDGDSSDPGRSR